MISAVNPLALRSEYSRTGRPAVVSPNALVSMFRAVGAGFNPACAVAAGFAAADSERSALGVIRCIGLISQLETPTITATRPRRMNCDLTLTIVSLPFLALRIHTGPGVTEAPPGAGNCLIIHFPARK